ncbi:MAG: hypothetical protein ACKVS9_09465 [Phycisphaerae bacterium]
MRKDSGRRPRKSLAGGEAQRHPRDVDRALFRRSLKGCKWISAPRNVAAFQAANARFSCRVPGVSLRSTPRLTTVKTFGLSGSAFRVMLKQHNALIPDMGNSKLCEQCEPTVSERVSRCAARRPRRIAERRVASSCIPNISIRPHPLIAGATLAQICSPP